MAPNAARLIIAPEDELEFGKELGSGAFGTVYEVRVAVSLTFKFFNYRVFGNHKLTTTSIGLQSKF